MRSSAWFGWSATVLVLASCAVSACGADDDESLIPDFDGGTASDASGDGSATKSDGSTPGVDGATADVFVPGVDAGQDSGVDSGIDSGVDSGIDSGSSGDDDDDDTTLDAGADADAGDDAGEDAGEDASPDAGADAGEDAGDGGGNGGTCGGTLGGFATFLPVEASGPSGHKVQYASCGEATTGPSVSSAFAQYTLSAASGATGYVTATGDATHRTTVTSYVDSDLLLDGPAVYLPANTFASPFDDTKAHAMISVDDDTDDDSCPIEGVTVSIPDHAEGSVKYLDVNGIDQGGELARGTGDDDASGVAYFSGLTPGSDFTGATLDNLPPGCTATYYYTVDGRTPLVAGTVSVLNVRLAK